MKSSLFLLTLIVRWTVRQTTGAERLHKCKEWTPITPRTYGTRLQTFTFFSSNLGQRLVHFVIRKVFRSCFQKSLQEVPWIGHLNKLWQLFSSPDCGNSWHEGKDTEDQGTQGICQFPGRLKVNQDRRDKNLKLCNAYMRTHINKPRHSEESRWGREIEQP